MSLYSSSTKKRLPPILLLLWVNFLRDFVSLCKISFGRKDMLWRNFRAMQKEFGRDAFGFHPDTFQLPAEHDVLVKRWPGRPWWTWWPERRWPWWTFSMQDGGGRVQGSLHCETAQQFLWDRSLCHRPSEKGEEVTVQAEVLLQNVDYEFPFLRSQWRKRSTRTWRRKLWRRTR